MRRFLCGVALLGVCCAVASAEPRVAKLPPGLEGRAQIIGVEPVVPDMGMTAGALGESTLERSEEGLIIRVINDEALERGVTATGAGQAYVWLIDYNLWYSGYIWVRSVFDETDGSFVEMVMGLGNGWVPGNELSGLELMMCLSTGNIPATSTLEVELWDGDPNGWYDTVCSAGGIPAPIPGATCTFSDLPRGYTFYLTCDIPKTVINCDRVHMVAWTPDGCRWFPRFPSSDGVGSGLNHVPPDVGNGAIDGYSGLTPCENRTAGANCPTANGQNAGYCCDNGVACDHTDGTLECTNAYDCGDGVIDAGDNGFAYYGYQPTYYFHFMGAALAQTDTVMQVVPVSVDAPPPNTPADVTIGGNDVTIDQAYPGAIRHLWFELYASDWGNDTLKAWQAGIDASGYQAGLACGLTPWRPACTDTADCVAALGPQGVGALAGGCNMMGMPPDVCMAGWANDTRSDYIFVGKAELGGVDQSTLNYRYGSTLMGNPIPSPHIGDMYLGTLALTTDCDCPAGDFQVRMGLPNVNSNMVLGSGQFVPLLGVVPANISFPIGQCCNLDETVEELKCVSDIVTRCECEAMADAGGWRPYFNPNNTCDDPCIECEADADCADGDSCTVDTCVDLFCVHEAVTVPAGSCCDYTTGDDVNGGGPIAAFDDGNQCTADSCSAPDACAVGAACGVPYNEVLEGDPCYDGEPCITVEDTCQADGTCVGTDILTVPCTTNEKCEALTMGLGSCNFVTGFCRCVPPSLNFDIDPSGKQNACFEIGEAVVVDVYFKDVPVYVGGGQFVIEYDPTCLTFENIAPGPFYPTEFAEIVDTTAGTIFYAVGVNYAQPECQISTAVLATATFHKTGVCETCNLCFGGANPVDTLLTDCAGWLVEDVVENCSDDVMENDVITLDVPDDVETNINQCDEPTACVYWDAPTAAGSCYDVDLNCTGPFPVGHMHYVDPMTGGCLPAGEWTFSCTATSTVCGDSVQGDWTVTVNDEVTLDVTLQVSPLIKADEVDRCIKFELFTDCVQDPYVFSTPVTLGGLWDHTGHFTEAIKVPVDGNYACITARDQLHTLRSCQIFAPDDCVDGVYYATFKGDPFFGGNWLIGGNLDGYKKDNPNASVDVINILDFGQFVAAYGTNYGTGDTTCSTQGPHADINGDGLVDALDFTFVAMNFLQSSKECCCGGGGVASAIDTAVSVEWLRANGMAELAAGDLNRDGMLDVNDLQAFQAGKRPLTKVRDRSSAGIR